MEYHMHVYVRCMLLYVTAAAFAVLVFNGV